MSRLARLSSLALVAGLAAALLGACNSSSSVGPAGAGATGSAATALAEDPATVIATIGTEKITLGELDKPIRGRLRALDKEHREQKHKMREAGLDALIAKKLIEAEAKKRGVTEEQLVKAEVEDKITEPTEDEIKAFYEQNAARMPGPMDQMRDQIGQYLRQDKGRKLFFEYFDGLKKAANVQVSLAAPEEPPVEVAADGPAKGAPDAKITIVIFSDFECPFCSRALPSLDRVMAEYAGQVKLVFRDFPLPFHQKAQKAAEAGHCAAEQGKFWELHDKMFQNQDKLDVAGLKTLAQSVGVEAAKFDECLDSGRMAEKVKKNAEAGAEAGVEGTPAFFVNGHLLSGALPFEEFKTVIDRELARAGGAPKPAAN